MCVSTTRVCVCVFVCVYIYIYTYIYIYIYIYIYTHEGRTESHEQLFFARELGTADEGEYDGRWNQLLCYP